MMDDEGRVLYCKTFHPSFKLITRFDEDLKKIVEMVIAGLYLNIQ